MRSMVKRKAAWHAILPGGVSPTVSTLEELRAARQAHGFLTEEVLAPEHYRTYLERCAQP